MTTSFHIALLLHIAAAIAAVGPVLAYPALRRADALPVAARLHRRLTLPALALAGILGFGAMATSNGQFDFEQPWIHASIATWLLLLGLAGFVLRPALRNGDHRRLSTGVATSHLLVVVALFLMVFKPGL